jgi:hypothetical protein
MASKKTKSSTGEFCVLFNEASGVRKHCTVADSVSFFENSAEAGNFIVESNFDTFEEAVAACSISE